jgi:transposase
MTRKENEQFAKRVLHYYKNGAGLDKKKTVHHFVKEGRPQGSIYKVLARYEATGENQYRPIPGRPPVKSSPKKVKKVEKAFIQEPYHLSACSCT